MAGSVFLLPGGLSFSREPMLMRTLLGSCVSVVVWHAQRQWGGMCHYLLPGRGRARGGEPADGRFGDEALALLAQQMTALGADMGEYVAHIAGGARCYDLGPLRSSIDIGRCNIEAARAWCAAQGVPIGRTQVGGVVHRHVQFDTADGSLQVREGPNAAAAAPTQETA